MNDEPGHQVADAAHRLEALEGVVGGLTQVGQDGQRRAGGEQEGVAVGERLGGGLGTDHAPGAAAVLDHELLAEHLAELVRPGPADEIGRAARGVGQDQLDRPVRPALRLGNGLARQSGCQQSACEPEENTTAHRPPPYLVL